MTRVQIISRLALSLSQQVHSIFKITLNDKQVVQPQEPSFWLTIIDLRNVKCLLHQFRNPLTT